VAAGRVLSGDGAVAVLIGDGGLDAEVVADDEGRNRLPDEGL
jgi:hypothetical protein